MLIREATLDDIPAILDIQKQIGPENPRAKERGFIALEIKEEKLVSLFNDDEVIKLVAIENNKVIGYFIGYPMDRLKAIFEEWHQLLSEKLADKDVNPHDTFYHEYIGVNPDYKGVGGKLIKEISSRASKLGFTHIICEIQHEPVLNTGSIGFHTHMGFRNIGEIPYVGAFRRLWGIYLKKTQ